MLLHDEFVFVANPRTASRSIESLLTRVLRHEDAFVTDLHHPKTDHPALKRDVPILGVVRDPLDWIVSWFHHCRFQPEQFPMFVERYENGWLYKNNLAVYGAYMTGVLPLTLGVSEIVRTIAGDQRWDRYVTENPFAEEPFIGRTGPEPELWTPRLKEIAQDRFPMDFALWQSIRT